MYLQKLIRPLLFLPPALNVKHFKTEKGEYSVSSKSLWRSPTAGRTAHFWTHTCCRSQLTCKSSVRSAGFFLLSLFTSCFPGCKFRLIEDHFRKYALTWLVLLHFVSFQQLIDRFGPEQTEKEQKWLKKKTQQGLIFWFPTRWSKLQMWGPAVSSWNSLHGVFPLVCRGFTQNVPCTVPVTDPLTA